MVPGVLGNKVWDGQTHSLLTGTGLSGGGCRSQPQRTSQARMDRKLGEPTGKELSEARTGTVVVGRGGLWALSKLGASARHSVTATVHPWRG